MSPWGVESRVICPYMVIRSRIEASLQWVLGGDCVIAAVHGGAGGELTKLEMDRDGTLNEQQIIKHSPINIGITPMGSKYIPELIGTAPSLRTTKSTR